MEKKLPQIGAFGVYCPIQVNSRNIDLKRVNGSNAEHVTASIRKIPYWAFDTGSPEITTYLIQLS
jgi:hypothetical protein